MKLIWFMFVFKIILWMIEIKATGFYPLTVDSKCTANYTHFLLWCLGLTVELDWSLRLLSNVCQIYVINGGHKCFERLIEVVIIRLARKIQRHTEIESNHKLMETALWQSQPGNCKVVKSIWIFCVRVRKLHRCVFVWLVGRPVLACLNPSNDTIWLSVLGCRCSWLATQAW